MLDAAAQAERLFEIEKLIHGVLSEEDMKDPHASEDIQNIIEGLSETMKANLDDLDVMQGAMFLVAIEYAGARLWTPLVDRHRRSKRS